MVTTVRWAAARIIHDDQVVDTRVIASPTLTFDENNFATFIGKDGIRLGGSASWEFPANPPLRIGFALEHGRGLAFALCSCDDKLPCTCSVVTWRNGPIIVPDPPWWWDATMKEM